jgi:DNA-binding CsgD family transcriptional regulator
MTPLTRHGDGRAEPLTGRWPTDEPIVAAPVSNAVRVPVMGREHGDVMPDRPAGPPTHRRFVSEWDRLRRRPDRLARAATWRLVEGAVTDLDQLVDAARSGGAHAERRLHRLVALAADDELAGRIVLQVLLPELVRLHRRRRAQGWDEVDLGDLLTTAWVVIRTYNPDRRPARLANSLVSDVDWREYRAALRRKAEHRCTQPTEFDRLVDERDPTPLDELVALLTDARAAGLSDDELDLVRRIASGRRTSEVAAELGVTARTIRNRRERISVRLRRLAVAA